MKQRFLFFSLIVFFLFSGKLTAQVTTSPAIVVQQTGSAVTIIFDASQVSALSGVSPIYAHTGVITTASANNNDWKNVITPWPNGTNSALANTTANTLTQVAGSSTKWQLTISPDINTFYGLTAGTVVTQLAFVFRNAAGTLQSSNIYVPVFQPGLNLQIASPTTNTLVPINTATTITTNASNGTNSCSTSIYTGTTTTANITSTTPIATGTNTVTTSYTYTTPGNYYIIAKVTSNSVTAYDTTYVCVPKAQVSLARPSGLKEGVTVNADGSVTFCFSLGYAAPVSGSTQVFLLGDFNNFKLDNNYMMNRQAESTTYGVPVYFYWLTVPGLNPTTEYAYQYYVAGLTGTNPVRVGDPYCQKILDPNNDQYINQTYDIYPNLRPYPSNLASGILSCFQMDPTPYQWQVTNFTPPPQSQLTIYEMLFRDFTTQGSVQAAIQKLDYIKSLGVNAVELMPIMEFDGNNSWGYNPNFYFAPDKAYGTKADYQQFIDECHKRGLAVILDVVFNHTWGLSPYCMVYWDAVNNRPAATNPYYNALAPHPYSVGNDINHTYPPVKAWLSRALQFWLTEYHVDGFRFDLSKGFTQTVSVGSPQATSSTTIQCESYDQSRVNNIETYINAVKATNPKAYCILEHFCVDQEENTLAAYDSTMLWRNVSNAFDQAAMGYSTSSDFSTLASASNSGGTVTLPTNRVSYAESHDEYRMGYKAITYGVTDVRDTTNVMKQLAVCGGFAFLSPGPRMMWEFGELGADYDSKDASGNNITSPVPALWNYLNIPARKALHDTYAKILNFRDQYPSLFSNPTNWSWQVATTNWTNGRRVYLTNGSITAVVLGNFTATGSVTAYPAFGKTGTWYDLISGQSLNVTDPNMSITLPEFGLSVYTDQPVTLPNLNTSVTNVSAATVHVYPNPTSDNLFVSGGNAVSIEVISLNGIEMLNKPFEANAVSLGTLPAGMYIGRIHFADGTSQVVKVSKR
jgi:1,4-alpha-glucan branching enzyme